MCPLISSPSSSSLSLFIIPATAPTAPAAAPAAAAPAAAPAAAAAAAAPTAAAAAGVAGGGGGVAGGGVGVGVGGGGVGDGGAVLAAKGSRMIRGTCVDWSSNPIIDHKFISPKLWPWSAINTHTVPGRSGRSRREHVSEHNDERDYIQ